MKLEAKIIESALNEDSQVEVAPPINTPTIGAPTVVEEVPMKYLTYRELKEGARAIMQLTAFNFNTLYKEQGYKDYPQIDEAKFTQFYFGSSELVGMFKIVFADSRAESTACACWNGSKLRVI
jgi:hypothetical protein